MGFLVMIMIISIILIVLGTILEIIRVRKINDELHAFMFHSQELTPEDFQSLRTKKQGRSYISSLYNIPGVYILENKTTDMFYVGQGKKILDRVNSHFSGRGNGDVYADYKYGTYFTIRIIPLEITDYDNLNDLEREYIRFLGACKKGYNKTRGNK